MNLDMKEGNQTAVEWLFEKLWEEPRDKFTWYSILRKAKEIEKGQIIEAFDEGQEYEYQYHINSAPKFDSETYYKETYGGEK
jgi:hypothetical protein